MSKGVKRDSLMLLNSLIQRIQSVCTMLSIYDRELKDVDPEEKNPDIVDARANVREAINRSNDSVVSLRKAYEMEKGGQA